VAKSGTGKRQSIAGYSTGTLNTVKLHDAQTHGDILTKINA